MHEQSKIIALITCFFYKVVKEILKNMTQNLITSAFFYVFFLNIKHALGIAAKANENDIHICIKHYLETLNNLYTNQNICVFEKIKQQLIMEINIY